MSRKKRLTYVQGDRTPTDPVSKQILEVANTGTSIFDPVLCELAYRWFSPQGGTIIDPFAGGSVRGIVASRLGRHYHGIDLRPEQTAANYAQAKAICDSHPPAWITGDSRTELCKAPAADFLFSCPPYADLEIYSDDPRDLSNIAAQDYDAFIKIYREIIAASLDRLRDNRFACFVVGEVRDRNGFYRNFVGDTIEAFEAAGARYYNEAILVTAVGSLPIRAGRQFSAGRKLGKTHQNMVVFTKGSTSEAEKALALASDQFMGGALGKAHEQALVFVKGDPKAATTACGPVSVPTADLDAMQAEITTDALLKK